MEKEIAEKQKAGALSTDMFEADKLHDTGALTHIIVLLQKNLKRFHVERLNA